MTMITAEDFRGRVMETGINKLVEFDRDVMRGFSRSIAEIEWLLLILVMLYLMVPGTIVTNRDAIIVAMVVFTIFVIAFHYANFYRQETRWKLAIETMAMIAFITVVLWYTGRNESPLLNLYLLVVIASALTLGKIMTLLEVGLISACYYFLGYAQVDAEVFTLAYASKLLSELAPFLLVAYLTTMLSSDIHEANSKIRALAETDELTGLLNMRGFLKIMEREHEQAARYSRNYSIMMIEMDNVKYINDRYGHEEGNRLIKHVATVLNHTFRNTDALARYGGDEFVALLTETNQREAELVVTRVMSAINATRLVIHGEEITPQVRLGFSSYPFDGTEVKDLMVTADLAANKSQMDSEEFISETPRQTPAEDST